MGPEHPGCAVPGGSPLVLPVGDIPLLCSSPIPGRQLLGDTVGGHVGGPVGGRVGGQGVWDVIKGQCGVATAPQRAQGMWGEVRAGGPGSGVRGAGLKVA